MVVSVSISPEAESKLKSKAVSAGVDVETYVSRVVERLASSPASVEAISGSVAEDFARSGMTEDELAEFLEVEKHAMRAERRQKRAR
jgi:hypothetical protein